METGLFEIWMTETIHHIPAKVHHGDFELRHIDLIKNLRISDLQSVFIIVVFGYVLSLSAFICEIMYSRRSISIMFAKNFFLSSKFIS